MFQFHDPGPLTDDDLVLAVREEYPGDPALNYVPAHKFKMMRRDQPVEIGNIELRIGNTKSIVMYGGHIAYEVEPAGATFVEIVDLPKDNDMYQRGARQKCRYWLDL